jgi:hypothetical protein
MLAVMPLLNNNSFLSNIVMAQEYDKYEDSSYSQYPTDDKKYDCRTGPFEGFFLSSVEFCKHVKFDDKDDNKRDSNRTGTQGLPGTNGTQGPQGIPGITFLNLTNTYEVTAIDNGTTFEIDLEEECDPGDYAINVGYRLNVEGFTG